MKEVDRGHGKQVFVPLRYWNQYNTESGQMIEFHDGQDVKQGQLF